MVRMPQLFIGYWQESCHHLGLSKGWLQHGRWLASPIARDGEKGHPSPLKSRKWWNITCAIWCWSHKTILVQSGRSLHKDMNTVNQKKEKEKNPGGYKVEELTWSLKKCNLGDTDLCNPKKHSMEEKESRAYKDKRPWRLLKVTWQELWLILMQVRK